MATSQLIGKQITITDKESPYYSKWGTIRSFNSIEFKVEVWDGSKWEDTIIELKRKQFKVNEIYELI